MAIILLISALLIYFKIFNGFFYMDDFYFLKFSQAEKLGQFLDFFKPIEGIPYRPISQQLFFFLWQKIFGLNPQPYYIFIFIIHFLNSILVFKISEKLIKSNFKAKLIAICYAVSSIHFMGMFSITGSYNLFGVFYYLISFWFWLKHIKTKKNVFYFLSIFIFILGIFSAEIVFSLPLILFLTSEVSLPAYAGIPQSRRFLRKVFKTAPFFLIIIVNLLINIYMAGAPKTRDFQLKLLAFPKLFKWYILRGIGIPEGIKNTDLINQFIIYGLFVILVGLIVISLYLKRNNFKKIILGNFKYLFWIIIAAFPFYLMPNHLNPLYFSISLIGLLLLISQLLTKKFLKLFALVFIFISFFGVNVLYNTHWTIRRSKLAESWIKRIGQSMDKTLIDYNILITENKVFLELPDKQTKDELKVVLQDNTALQVYFNNPKLKTIYLVENNDK